MKIIIVDTFIPEINSCAIQISALIESLEERGEIYKLFSHRKDKIGFCKEIKISGSIHYNIGIGNIKSKPYIIRFLKERLYALIVFCILFFSVFKEDDEIISYSPSVAVGLVGGAIAKIKKVKSKLILRDIFPDWAFHSGILKSRIVFKILSFEKYLHLLLNDKIFIQSEGDLSFISAKFVGKTAVLNNWLPDSSELNRKNAVIKDDSSIRIIYAGNVGTAQSLSMFLNALEGCKNRDYRLDIFGHGSQIEHIRTQITLSKYLNERVRVYDPILTEELSSIYRNYDFGLISLNSDIESNNIPGKYIDYIRHNLPVLLLSNSKIELVRLISSNKVGVYLGETKDEITACLKDLNSYAQETNPYNTYKKLYSTEIALRQLSASF